MARPPVGGRLPADLFEFERPSATWAAVTAKQGSIKGILVVRFALVKLRAVVAGTIGQATVS